MKKLLLLIAMSAIFMSYSYSQDECNTTAVGLSYLVPKGASIEVIMTGRFQIGAAAMYNALTTDEKGKTGESTRVDLLTFAGVRVYHVEYRTAIYPIIGVSMGNIYGPRLYLGGKLMLLRNQRALSIEPYYWGRPGLKLGIFQII